MKTKNRDELKHLSDMQYEVTQKEATEPSYNNKYWKNTEDGLYVDVVDNMPLFLSKDKIHYNEASGWPSFTKVIDNKDIETKTDYKAFYPRTEVHTKSESHLGHIFPNPKSPTGQNFCINSASIRFIPKADLEKEGFGRFLKYFTN